MSLFSCKHWYPHSNFERNFEDFKKHNCIEDLRKFYLSFVLRARKIRSLSPFFRQNSLSLVLHNTMPLKQVKLKPGRFLNQGGGLMHDGWCARLRRIERSGLESWPGTFCCVLGQDPVLSQSLSPPRCINGYWRI